MAQTPTQERPGLAPLLSQLQYLAEYAQQIVAHGGYTDSDYDYLSGALELANAMLGDDYDGTTQAAELAQQIGYLGDCAPEDVAAYLGVPSED